MDFRKLLAARTEELGDRELALAVYETNEEEEKVVDRYDKYVKANQLWINCHTYSTSLEGYVKVISKPTALDLV